MPRLALLALTFLLTACANSATLAPRQMVVVGQSDITSTAEAVGTQAAALPITESAANEQFRREQTQTFTAPALKATQQSQALIDATITAVWVDSTATAVVRASESVRVSVAMSTAIPATGTALAVVARNEAADAMTAEAVSNLTYALGGLTGLAALVLVGIGGYWLWGRARADLVKANTAAENNKPQVFEDVLVYPSPTGGYIHQRLLRPPAPLPALAPPAEIMERIIGGQTNGRPHSITKSEPVNQHEKLWRDCLVATLFHSRECGSFASTELAGAGNLFSSNDHWQRVTDVLRDNDLILKDNGGKTVRAGEWTDIISRVQDATQPLRLPARLPPRLRPVEALKVL